MQLRHEDKTYALRGLAYDVRNALGMGWPEEVYHQGFIELAGERKIPVVSKPRKTIFHREMDVHTFECDLIAWDLILLEFKMLPNSRLAPNHFAQIIHYLKSWHKDLGLLINFGTSHIQIERVIWNEPILQVLENYETIDQEASTDWSIIYRIKDVLIEIGHQYGLGYPETMYRKILSIELASQGLNCVSNIQVTSRINERTLAQHFSEHLLVENKFLLHIRSLLEFPTKYDFAQTKTFLNALGQKTGIIANFGKKQLQIFGVNSE